MSAAELNVVLSSNREGGDLWMSNRRSKTASWPQQVALDDSIKTDVRVRGECSQKFNTSNIEQALTALTSDGLPSALGRTLHKS